MVPVAQTCNIYIYADQFKKQVSGSRGPKFWSYFLHTIFLAWFTQVLHNEQ